MRRTGPDLDTRDLVWTRDRFLCVVCQNGGEQLHHRSARRMGGTTRLEANSPSNLVLLCRPCHADIESRRDHAIAHGWLVPSWGDPAGTSLTWHGKTVRLNPDGTTTDALPKETP